MEEYKVRYAFEHRLLPQWFFKDKEKVVLGLLHDKKVLYRIISEMYQEQGMEIPYSEDQFKVEAGKLTQEVMSLRFVFPEPEIEPLCYCSYCFFDKDFEKIGYYSIEKGGMLTGEPEAFACEVMPDGGHSNLGSCSPEGVEGYFRCVKSHMQEKYGVDVDSQN
jgi:hypothetical protein